MLEREFWIGRDAPRASADAARELGVLDSARQREAIRDVMETEIIPGLDALGLSGSASWAARDRCAARSFADGPATIVSTAIPYAEAPAAAKLATDWLERAVAEDGSVRFSMDAISGRVVSTGPMHHGRAAVVLAALRGQGRSESADRLEARLLEDLREGTSGRPPQGWPEQPARIAGTLALACLAGCDVRDALEATLPQTSFEGEAWHAAQVVTALAVDAPAALWELCVRDLERTEWAPWTARAALARGDVQVRTLCVRKLIISLNGLDVRGVTVELPAPAIARVAATVEALAGEDSTEALQALEAARAYLCRWQFSERPPPGLDPEICRGAFPLSPEDWELRTDVTAHAALALALLA
jgi:hypothetical protein